MIKKIRLQKCAIPGNTLLSLANGIGEIFQCYVSISSKSFEVTDSCGLILEKLGFKLFKIVKLYVVA
jgi:hypothetical protein